MNTWLGYMGPEDSGLFPDIWLDVHGARRQRDISRLLAGVILNMKTMEYFPTLGSGMTSQETVGYFQTLG